MPLCSSGKPSSSYVPRRAAQLTIIGGALGMTGAIQLRTAAEATFTGFRWVAANSNISNVVHNRIETGKGFPVLWAIFSVGASMLFFLVILISTEADVVVEEEPAPENPVVRELIRCRPRLTAHSEPTFGRCGLLRASSSEALQSDHSSATLAPDDPLARRLPTARRSTQAEAARRWNEPVNMYKRQEYTTVLMR